MAADLQKKLMAETKQKYPKNTDFIEFQHQSDKQTLMTSKSQSEFKENVQTKCSENLLAKKLSEEKETRNQLNRFEVQEDLSQHPWNYDEQTQEKTSPKPANIEDLKNIRSSSSDDGFIKIYQGFFYIKRL